jgi:hypothetical protein
MRDATLSIPYHRRREPDFLAQFLGRAMQGRECVVGNLDRDRGHWLFLGLGSFDPGILADNYRRACWRHRKFSLSVFTPPWPHRRTAQPTPITPEPECGAYTYTAQSWKHRAKSGCGPKTLFACACAGFRAGRRCTNSSPGNAVLVATHYVAKGTARVPRPAKAVAFSMVSPDCAPGNDRMTTTISGAESTV